MLSPNEETELHIRTKKSISLARSDVVKSNEFAFLVPFMFLGKVHYVAKGHPVTIAATDGIDEFYNIDSFKHLPRKDAAYIIAHEALHKGLSHCFYNELVEAQGLEKDLVDRAMDYVVNLLIADLDPLNKITNKPTAFPPLYDESYKGLNFLQVLEKLKSKDKSNGGGFKIKFDQHLPNKSAGADDTEGKQQKLKAALIKAAQIESQSIIQQSNLDKRATDALGLHKLLIEVTTRAKTNYLSVLRNVLYMKSPGCTEGTFNPPNRRFLPLDLKVPQKIDRTAKKILIAGDSSGSMDEHHKKLLPEIFKLLQQFPNTEVRLVWWGTVIAHDEIFNAQSAKGRSIKHLIDLCVGAGGTDPNVVNPIIEKYKPDVCIYLTDAEFFGAPKFNRKVCKLFVLPSNLTNFKAPDKNSLVIEV